MSRYIDAEEFEKYINREEWKTPDEKWWPEREIGMIMDTMPTADVVPTEFHDKCMQIEIEKRRNMVEVVRCKDCISCVPKYMDFTGEPYWICHNWVAQVDADGFCYEGKRREDG